MLLAFLRPLSSLSTILLFFPRLWIRLMYSSHIDCHFIGHKSWTPKPAWGLKIHFALCVGLRPKDTLTDLYAGVGTLGVCCCSMALDDGIKLKAYQATDIYNKSSAAIKTNVALSKTDTVINTRRKIKSSDLDQPTLGQSVRTNVVIVGNFPSIYKGSHWKESYSIVAIMLGPIGLTVKKLRLWREVTIITAFCLLVHLVDDKFVHQGTHNHLTHLGRSLQSLWNNSWYVALTEAFRFCSCRLCKCKLSTMKLVNMLRLICGSPLTPKIPPKTSQ